MGVRVGYDCNYLTDAAYSVSECCQSAASRSCPWSERGRHFDCGNDRDALYASRLHGRFTFSNIVQYRRAHHALKRTSGRNSSLWTSTVIWDTVSNPRFVGRNTKDRGRLLNVRCYTLDSGVQSIAPYVVRLFVYILTSSDIPFTNVEIRVPVSRCDTSCIHCSLLPAPDRIVYFISLTSTKARNPTLSNGSSATVVSNYFSVFASCATADLQSHWMKQVACWLGLDPMTIGTMCCAARRTESVASSATHDHFLHAPLDDSLFFSDLHTTYSIARMRRQRVKHTLQASISTQRWYGPDARMMVMIRQSDEERHLSNVSVGGSCAVDECAWWLIDAKS